MIKQFDEQFKTQLYETIEDIENHSLVEVVVIIKARSGRYLDVPLWIGFASLLIALTYMMFAPAEFAVPVIYFGSILAFLAGYFLCFLITPLQRFFIPKKRLQRNAEIHARAIFQKGGIRHTEEKIGVLIYCSLFEKQTIVVADRGAETLVPDDEWEKIRHGMQLIYKGGNAGEVFLQQLRATKTVFAEFIPPVENDINELPDDLEVDI